MQPQKRTSRIDIADLKAQIVKKIGSEKSKRYMYYLNRFLSKDLSKSEFDKFCNRVLGRENLPLHNLFIVSILKNACNAKTPPSTKEAGPAKSSVHDGNEQSGSVRSNVFVLPISPKKIRSCKLRDRPNPRGTHELPNNAFHHQSMPVKENGDSTKKIQDHAEQPENHSVVSFQQPLQRPHVQNTVDEDQTPIEHGSTPLLAPVGIPFCSASVGGSRKILPGSSSNNYFSYYDSGGLYNIETLKKRMGEIAEAQGLEGVSLECATIMNTMVDLHLKKLIKSCLELVGARSGNELKKQVFHQKLLDGMWPNNHLPMQGQKISLRDFKVAMELNPQQLGEDWPLLIEKICFRAFEE